MVVPSTGTKSRGRRTALSSTTRARTQRHWRSVTSRTSTSSVNDMPVTMQKNTAAPGMVPHWLSCSKAWRVAPSGMNTEATT